MRKLRTFFFCVEEALLNLKKDRLKAAIAMLIIAFTLTNVGLFLLLTFNFVPKITDNVGNAKITAYLNKNISPKRIKELTLEIREWEEIETINFISKKETRSRFRKMFSSKNDAILLEGLEENSLPPSYDIVIKSKYSNNKERIKKIYTQLETKPEFEEIISKEKAIGHISSIIFLVKSIGYSLGVALLFICIFIISNTMRLSFYHKHDQIEIMRLVGASNFCLKAPFLIEGLFCGFLGGILSVIFLYICFLGASFCINSSFFNLFGHARPIFISYGAICFLIFLGMFVGGGGSLFLSP
ncbi:MAG TPA: permease-like cell division protein FtsX [Candidatus Paceibacterota bacterium]|nr:permease-like cell division protein FtsX [Candidatus Paceibacterota bacterium]